MKTNVKRVAVKERTHGGAISVKTDKYNQLRRSVLSCLLWEDEFYEDGKTISDRIKSLIKEVKPEQVAELAIEAREKQNLRHIPLLIVREMARLDSHKSWVSETLYRVIQRPDELAEFLSIYWKEKKQPISAQVKKGLAKAFTKFNEYSLAKYNRDNAIKLRDVLFLTHAKPLDGVEGFNKAARKKKIKFPKKSQGSVLFKKLVDNELKTPDTWEVALSGGDDKKETFERLMEDGKLGGLAFIRNLRNMEQSGISKSLVKDYVDQANFEKVLPFRFITAAKHVPKWEDVIEKAMFKCLDKFEKMPGKTVLVVDVSGSMGARLSGKSELSRIDAAAALAILARELCEEVVIYCTAGNDASRIHRTELVPARHGFALSEQVKKCASSLGGGGIFLTQVTKFINDLEKNVDRLIVFTDEQDCDNKLNPSFAIAFGEQNYLVNIASAKNGIGYKKWIHIDGFSENTFEFITELEKELN